MKDDHHNYFTNLYHAEERQEAPERDEYKKMKKEEKKYKKPEGGDPLF